jgi:hypothetical protein
MRDTLQNGDVIPSSPANVAHCTKPVNNWKKPSKGKQGEKKIQYIQVGQSTNLGVVLCQQELPSSE